VQKDRWFPVQDSFTIQNIKEQNAKVATNRTNPARCNFKIKFTAYSVL